MPARFCLLAALAICFIFAGRAAAEQVVALAPNNTLILFDTATPNTTTALPITGLGPNETVRGIDYRPLTGQLVAGTVTTAAANNSVIKSYRIDHTTGAATLLGATAAGLAGAGDVPTGYDVSPRPPALSSGDRIRYVNTNDENARLHPDSGALWGNDTDLVPSATTTIIGAAFDRNTGSTELTTLYLIDRNDSQISIQGGINGAPSPNGGVVTDLAPLGFNLNQARDGGFDISAGGTAIAALTNAADNLTGLYTLTLPTAVSASPVATLVGLISNGATEIYSLTILPPDSDGDGVRDPLDGCPGDPAKTAAGACGCGVADTDSDGDGAADCNDGCPNDAAKTAGGTCGCGVADADSDGDGTVDCFDGCPSDAGKAAPGLCGCGAPDTDTDGDGAADCSDGCPNDAAKITPGACGCGTADADSDADGVADCVDNCPADANLDQADDDADGVGDACEDGPANACGLCGNGMGMMVSLMLCGYGLTRLRRRPTSARR